METVMFGTILVPLDGSTRAETILAYVEDLALAQKSKVVFMQAIEPAAMVTPYDMAPYFDVNLMERWVADAKAYLGQLQEAFRQKGIETAAFVEQGAVVRTILEVAEREKADLIAMASHGRTGLARAFYGSVAAGVLHQADRPLLLVRATGGD
jgi:nucleotide-binding universal stress UspA family protein